MAKSPSSLMSFCSPSYFPANDCYFACVSFHIPVCLFPPPLSSFPFTSRFVQHFSSQNNVEHARSSSLLQCTSFHIPLSVPSMYFFSSCFFLSHKLFLFVPVLSMIVPHFPSKKLVKHARSKSLLQRTFINYIQSVHKVRNYFVDNGVFFLIN